MSDLEELKRLAREAQAPAGRNGFIGPELQGARDAFRALANPAAALALIERVKRAAAEVSRLDSARAQQAERARRAEEDAKFNAARAVERNDFARRLAVAEAQIDAASLSLNRQPGESLEQAAERAMDEVAGLLERRAALETFARNFSEAVDGDLRAIEQRGKGGMQVSLTGDFVSAPPSVQSRLRWWAERAKEALKEGK